MSSLAFEVDESDIPFEEDILRNKYSVKAWWRYLEHKRTAPRAVRNMIFERALKELPGSYKLWYAYLRERRRSVRNRCPSDPCFEDLNKTYERCIVFLHKMPRIWMDYCNLMVKQGKITRSRQLFDRSLQALPITQHKRIWPLYLNFVKLHEIPETTVRVYRRYLMVEPYDVEDYIEYLKDNSRLDEAATCLAKIVNDDKFSSKKGKTPHQLWSDLCEFLSKYATDITSIKAEPIIRSGIVRFSDMVGNLWVALADHFIRLALFEKARDIYEEAITTVMTVRDFTLVFDAYSQFEETMISARMEALNNDDDCGEDELDLDIRIARFEALMDRRPILLSEVLLRQNPHNVNEWLKRAQLFLSNPVKVIETYSQAIQTVDHMKATGKLSTLWIEFAKYYEQNNQIREARTVFDKAVTKPFRKVEDLASVWCEYSEMEIRNKNYEQALSLIKQSTNQHVQLTPGDPANYIKARLCKNLQIWQLYIDLEESLGTFETTKAVYNQVLDQRIANPLMIINFAKFLQESNYYEESFKVYERGIGLFKWPHVYDLYLSYLQDFLERHVGRMEGSTLERARDIFDQVLEKCPKQKAKIFVLMYAKMEEDYGLTRRAMNVYDRAIAQVAVEDKLEVFRVYIKRAGSLFGITKTREIYEKALEELADKDATVMCMEFAGLELKLGEIDRARAIYNFGSQMNDPRTSHKFWKVWNDFEIAHGNESTFRDMLRLKRSCQAAFSTSVSLDHAKAVAQKQTSKPAQFKANANSTTVAPPNDMQQLQARQTNFVSASESANPTEIELDDSEEEKDDDVEEKSVPSAVFGGLSKE